MQCGSRLARLGRCALSVRLSPDRESLGRKGARPARDGSIVLRDAMESTVGVCCMAKIQDL